MTPEPGTVEVDWARHGQNVANVTRTMSHRVFDGDLTERGVHEAQLLGDRLDAETRRYAVIVCSPLARARHTADIVAHRLGGPMPETMEELREVDVGDLDGRSDDATWEAYSAVLGAWHRGDLTARFPGGESGEELTQRLRRALTTVARRAGPGPALVVAHGANIRAALPSLTSGPDPGADLPTGHVARLAVSPGDAAAASRFTLLAWGSPPDGGASNDPGRGST